MNVLDAIAARGSVRQFSDRTPTQDELGRLFDAANLAPNHRLTQPWRFSVLGPEARAAYGLALGHRKAKKATDEAQAESIRQKTSDERPLAIYRDDGLERTVEQVPTMALVDAAAGTISLPDGRIDMRNGDWLDLRGARVGRCEAMVRREGYALMREFLGRTPAPGATSPAAPVASEPAP